MRYKELYDEYNALLLMRSENLTVLSTLKDGYISTKTISGKRYAYIQKKIEGKLNSEYIKEDMLPQVKNELQKRREREKSIIYTDGQLAGLEAAAVVIDKSLYRKFIILRRCSAMDSMPADMRKKSLEFGNAMTAFEGIPASEDTETDSIPSTPKDYTRVGDYNVANYKGAPHVYLDENEPKK